MTTFKATLIALTTAAPVLAFSLPSQAIMDPSVEKALIKICKSVTTNKVYKYKKAAKAYHLRDRTVALKVMCNGEDIISFAENHGAYKTAAKLQKSVGNVSIIDTAAVTKWHATFSE